MLLDTSIRGGCYCTPLLGEGRALVFRDQGLLEYSAGIFRSQLETAVSDKSESDHMSTDSMDPCKRSGRATRGQTLEYYRDQPRAGWFGWFQ